MDPTRPSEKQLAAITLWFMVVTEVVKKRDGHD